MLLGINKKEAKQFAFSYMLDIHARRVYYYYEEMIMSKIEVPKISEILKEEFMIPYHLSAYRLAKEIDVPISRIQDLLHDRRKITAETSIKLGKYFGLSEKYLLNLQNDIDIREAKELFASSVNKIIPLVTR